MDKPRWASWFLGVALGVLVAVSGCARKVADGPPGTAAGSAQVGPPPSEDDCREFAEGMAKAVAAGDVAAINRLIDWDAMLATATAGVEASDEIRKGFADGVKSLVLKDSGLGGQLVEIVKKGGSYALLRLHARDKNRRALFRLIMPEQSGVNYHDFILARRPDGKVHAVDLYVFLAGERMSQTLRRGYIPAAANASRNLLERLTGEEQEFIKEQPKIQKLVDAQRAGHPREALDLYNQLPPGLKKDKTMLVARFQAAQGLNDNAEYSAAIEAFRANFPDDPCIDLLSVDYYLLKKEYPQALACLDRLDKSVGGDPFLRSMRSGIEIEAGDFDKALDDARRAVEEDPTLVDSYWNLVLASMKARKFDETARTLSTIRDKFGIEFNDMSTHPQYADFVKSPEYREWIKPGPGRDAKP